MYILNKKINLHFHIKKRYAAVIVFAASLILFFFTVNMRKITIQDFSATTEIFTSKKRVSDILKKAKIVIHPDDLTSPALDMIMPEDVFTIKIFRAEYFRYKKTVGVPQKTVEIETRALPKGRQLLINPGSKGFIEEIYNYKYIDGRKVKEELVDVNVICKPRNKIILIGISNKYSDNASDDSKRQKYFNFNASAYTPSVLSCAPFDDGITAIGLRADYGIAAVDPNFIPLGSLLYIEEYGYAIAGDVGSAIKHNSIDLCFRKNRVALEFGRKKVNAYLLD